MKKVSLIVMPLLSMFYILAVMDAVGSSFVDPYYSLFLFRFIPDWGISAVNFFYFIVYAILDPITGRIGDRYGHLKVALAGYLLVTIGFFVYHLASLLPEGQMFLGFLAAEGVIAIGAALESNALVAYFVSFMDRSEYKIHESRRNTLFSSIKLIMLLLLFTIEVNIATVFAMAASVFSFGLGIVYLVRLKYYDESEIAVLQERKSLASARLRTDSAESTQEVLSFGYVLSYIVSGKATISAIAYASGFMNLFFQGVNMYWALYMLEFGMLEQVPLFVAAYTGAMVIGDVLAQMCIKLGIDHAWVKLSVTLIALTFVGVVLGIYIDSYVIFVVMFIFNELFRKMHANLIGPITSELIDDDPFLYGHTATAKSVVSAIRMFNGSFGLLLNVVVLLFLGISMDTYWLIIAIGLWICAALVANVKLK